MRIKIIDKEKCERCSQRTCSMSDTVSKSDFYNLKTEQYTCPVKMFVYGVTDEQLEEGYIDFNLDKNQCLYCCLCAIQCSQDNLLIEGYEYDARSDFQGLKDRGELQSQGPTNIVAMSYLNILFNFAANTNLVRTLPFDGVLFNDNNEACLVEVDINNDSLECCRRLLAYIILYNHKNEKKIYNGLMILNDFPKDGSRDVFSLIRKIGDFEKTTNLNMYISTFSFLRYLALQHNKKKFKSFDLFYNPVSETQQEYIEKLMQKDIIAEDIGKIMFNVRQTTAFQCEGEE